MGSDFFSSFFLDAANVGLDAIIAYFSSCFDVLVSAGSDTYFAYFMRKAFGNDRRIYSWVTAFTAAAAILDFVKKLCQKIPDVIVKLQEMLGAVSKVLPISKYGFGWVCPALVGLMIGLAALQKIRKNKKISFMKKIKNQNLFR